MRYDGIETEVLLKRYEKETFILLAVFLAQGIGYLLYKHVEKHPAIAIMAILFFIAVIILSIIFTIVDTLPWRLKYIHGRNDVPKEALNTYYWCCFGDSIPVILGMIGYSIYSIWSIIHGGYL